MELTRLQIEVAKAGMVYSRGHGKPLHEHDDCIRIAYQWLDAQMKLGRVRHRAHPWKHYTENWGGRYVSQSDFEVAAMLHPKIAGTYPAFNISARLVLPSAVRLAGIGEAKTHSYRTKEGACQYYWLEMDDRSLIRNRRYNPSVGY